MHNFTGRRRPSRYLYNVRPKKLSLRGRKSARGNPFPRICAHRPQFLVGADIIRPPFSGFKSAGKGLQKSGHLVPKRPGQSKIGGCAEPGCRPVPKRKTHRGFSADKRKNPLPPSWVVAAEQWGTGGKPRQKAGDHCAQLDNPPQFPMCRHSLYRRQFASKGQKGGGADGSAVEDQNTANCHTRRLARKARCLLCPLLTFQKPKDGAFACAEIVSAHKIGNRQRGHQCPLFLWLYDSFIPQNGR